MDNFVGTAGGDTFVARTINGSNTFQDGDMLDGGAGSDVVYLDFASLNTNATTPNLKNIESVVVRAQSAASDANGVDANDGNNMPVARTVQIDAQRSLATDAANKVTADLGVTNWESSNSRSDVVIEDVRIGNTQKTKDITITFRESDPGNVDFGVYFDQHSLRNTGTGTTAINILLMDTAAAGTTATAATPLLNHNFNSYTFFVDNVKVVLGGAGTAAGTAIDNATTYPALLAAFQLALKTASVAGVVTDLSGGVTATLSGLVNMTAEAGKATESAAVAASFLNLTGQVLILSSAGTSAVASKSTAGEAGGWAAAGTAPSTGAIVQTFNTGSSSTTELVTSTIVLDDVGRGSTGGDLVVGGLSVGDTSTSRGVERFEITVQDSSKLQTINGTNNALREVTIVNGTTSNTSSAYNTVVANAGDLTVNGTNFTGTAITTVDTSLPGANTGSVVGIAHSGAGAAGFTDVRLIDGSAMTGKLAFTAAISTDSLAKYVNLTDTQNLPTGDVAGAGNVNFNVRGANFLYTGGSNADTMNVRIDSAVAASTTLTGQSDFTIVIDGGNGNDAITTNIGGNQTAAWLADQKSNANIRIEGGAGNDTITTTGAGAIIINAGAGDDTVYTDNSGNKAIWAVNDLAPALTADLWTAGAGGAGFLYGGKLTVSLSGAAVGGGVMAAVADSSAGTTADPFTNGLEVKVDVPTGANFAITQFHINQAIKKAINDDAVLSKLLTAADGPSNTLTITSKIDGAFVAGDLKMSLSAANLTTLSATEQATALAAFKIVGTNSAAVIANAQTANALTVTTANGVAGMDVNQVLGATAGSNLQFAVAVTTQGAANVTETAAFTFVDITAAAGGTSTVTINGMTVTVAAGATAVAVDIATAFDTQATVNNAVFSGAATAAWTDARVGNVVTFTSATANTNVTNLAATVGAGAGGTAPAAPALVTVEGSAVAAEVFTVTVTGQATATETITFDGTASAALLAGDSAATVAAAITGVAGGVYGVGTVVGNVVTFTANATGVTADATAANFATSIATVTATGSRSTAESDNTIDLAAGNDVLVLGTGALSNDTIVFTGADIGKNTIVNFSLTGTDADKLDFKSYLVDKSSATGAVESQVRIATSLNADTTVEANSITVLTPTFTATDTFAGLTGAKLLTAVNTTGNVAYAGLGDASLNAVTTYIGSGVGTTLVGGVGNAIVAVQNNANEGEYAVFHLTFSGVAANATAAFTTATLLGTVDFGNGIDGAALANFS